MKAFSRHDYLLIFTAFVLMAAAISVATLLEGRETTVSTEIERESLSLQGERLKGYAFGFEGLLADWYWMRSLQYIGDKIYEAKEKDIEVDIDNLKPLDPRLLYPLLDTATSLDPQFLAAYSYAANVLPAIDDELAIEMAKKGIESNPEEWTVYHQLGFIYWRLEDYENASKTYERGSRVTGAPGWMAAMSARMNTEGGSTETARAIYEQLLNSAADSQTRESAQLRLLELDSDENRKVLDEALTDFKEARGRCAGNWEEVIRILTTKTLPAGRDFRIDSSNNIVDPTNAPYLIDQESCTSNVDFSRSKLPRS